MKPRMLTILLMVFQLSVFSSGTSAQSLRNAQEPAEFPPNSFQGKQYVDSRGCVYVRAGIDGNVTWVPRVGRDRKLVCGYQPTVIAGAPARPATNNETVVKIIPAPEPAPASVAQVPVKPTVKTAVKAVPVRAAAPRVVAPEPVAHLPRPVVKPVVIKARPVAPKPAPKAVQICVDRTPYTGDHQDVGPNGLAVRCGPQIQKPHDFVIIAPEDIASLGVGSAVVGQTRRIVGTKQAATLITPHTRVAPRHVYEQQLAAADVGRVPAGFKRAWTDGRLNQHRAHQTLAGKAKMDRIWTQTVPRRLILRPVEAARVTAVTPVLSSKSARKSAQPGFRDAVIRR